MYKSANRWYQRPELLVVAADNLFWIDHGNYGPANRWRATPGQGNVPLQPTVYRRADSSIPKFCPDKQNGHYEGAEQLGWALE